MKFSKAIPFPLLKVETLSFGISAIFHDFSKVTWSDAESTPAGSSHIQGYKTNQPGDMNTRLVSQFFFLFF